MLKSKFTSRTLIIPALIIALTCLSIYIVNENRPIVIKELSWIEICLAVLLLFSWVWLVFGELRTKVIQVSIHNNYVEKKNYLGFKKKYNFKDFDGFETSILTSEDFSYEYLYLVKDNQKIIKISEWYHKNYSELKNKIAENSKDLGEINFSFFDEIKEIYK